MNRIIQDSTMIDEYFPSCDLVPTSEESDTIWFGSSLQYIVSFGLMKPASEKMQPSFERHVFENMKVDGGDNDCLEGFDGKVDGGNDGGNDCFHGKVEGFSCSEGHYNLNASTHSRKKRSGKPLGGCNLDDETQNFLIEQFQKLLDDRFEENYQRLAKLVKPESTISKGADRASNATERVDAVSCGVNDNCSDYHVKTDKLHPSSEKQIEDIEVAETRKSDRLSKPSSWLLSPFVVMNKVAGRKNRKEVKEVPPKKKIKQIKEWAEKEQATIEKGESRVRKLGLTIETEVGPDFWLCLLGVQRSGWLDDDVRTNFVT
ncbi:uncharacterized protein LOC110874030 isoform X1 [Helianthus annuus]|uniref:uncharacterized protein LOC110874030 isoform X1 n=1 Tax=Helianthus annuus TaxID=4232 RepID=UPI001652F0C5|nr:uncharacterized protein LOC110874030 isoform X1 [Helianthus annuus]KAJ0540466.1 hypothetical protein HanHA89_Chr09g0317151 [Helianthus annuus]